MIILAWSTAALLTGFLLDMIFGDPYNFPHIIRWVGKLIAALEKLFRSLLPGTPRGESAGGILLVFCVILICTGIPFLVLLICYRSYAPLGFIVESFLCYQLLAAKSLKTESMKVYESLINNNIESARKNVSMIVGRDTAMLDKDGITRAAVETVAENASDGAAAPLLYMMLGGAVLGSLYKAVNTMDSMVGYKNDKYNNFGRAAAKVDDVLNYIPSRICAVLMIVSAYLLRLDGKNAKRIWKRDRRKHASPNSAQTEAVCAGALGIRLAGPSSYHGTIIEKQYIGDDNRPVIFSDIMSANKLMYVTSALTFIIALVIRLTGLGVVMYAAL